MSRSIHTTRHTLSKLTKWSEPAEEKEKRLDAAYEELLKKRRIKEAVQHERKNQQPPQVATPVESIPIEVLDEKPDVMHGANREDIVAILSKLPEASRAGISRIQLSLGQAYQERFVTSREDYSHVCDPIYGRPGAVFIPGVYSGAVLGTYFQRTGMVAIYAFVLDEKEITLPPAALHIYLKLRALKTFMHEVAHHHDSTARVKRGRWLADRKPKMEEYAEKMEVEWTLQIVVPYLEGAYPAEVGALLDWVEHHGGVRLPFHFLAADPEELKQSALSIQFDNWSEAFEWWLEDFNAYKSILESRIQLARYLKSAGAFSECLKILDGILENHPADTSALVLKADTVICLGRSNEAETIVHQLLERDPNLEKAQEVMGNLLEVKKDWPGLLANVEKRLAYPTLTPARQRYALYQKSIAYCAMEDSPQLHKAISELTEKGFCKNREEMLERVYCRAGKAREKAGRKKRS
ncbi:MAG: tetratricopeptide repeat protein [Verrucomicrobiales bacterium]